MASHLSDNEETVTDFDGDFTTISLESSHPLYLHPSDHPGQILVAELLTGDNFNEWKRSMSRALSAKNKLGLVTGKYKTPGNTSPYFDSWQRCNDMIITWLLNSINPEIRSSLVYDTLASVVWSDLHSRFTQNNGPRFFEIRKDLASLVQENMTISAYYTKFKKLYDDMVSASNAPKCTCSAKSENVQYEEKVKVTQFLMGLNENFTNIRGQLLMMDPLPKMTQTLSLLQQDERQRNYSSFNTSVPESTVLMTRSVTDGNKSNFKKSNSGNPKSQTKKGTMECTHCHGTNHTRERCYHIIGFPPRAKQPAGKPKFQPNSGSKVLAQVNKVGDNGDNSTAQSASNSSAGFTDDQYHQLLALLNHSTNSHSGDPPQSGNYCSSMTTICLASCHTSLDWVLDSGATDHITCHNTLLINPIVCDINICLPNGHIAHVKTKGQIQLTSELILHDVLYIPDFHFNLVSISKLSSSSNFEVHFNAHHCIVQDPMKRVMGIGKLHGNLYKLILPNS
nr:PREDICTED: uncharacterized protein LOC108198480 [Daucus carota subsp. sativus]